MKSMSNRPIEPSFVRKKPPDVRLPDTLPSPNIAVTTSTGVSPTPTPTFHFQLPSRSTSPVDPSADDPALESGAASSPAQSPPPPFDECDRLSQFARFRQEVNRRMHSLLRTQLLPSQPTSPAPDAFSIGHAWPAYTTAAAAPIGVHLIPGSNYAYRSSLHPSAAIQSLGRYGLGGGRLSAPASQCTSPDKPLAIDGSPVLPRFRYDLANRSPVKFDAYTPLEQCKLAASWPLWPLTSSPSSRRPSPTINHLQPVSPHSLAPPNMNAAMVSPSGAYHLNESPSSDQLSGSIKSTGYCHFGLRLLFTLLKLALIVLLLLSCARLSTLFFSIPERVRLYVAAPATGQRALKLRICFQLMFSFALLVQLIQLYGVMYERFCLSGTFGAIQSAILTLMALDARAANETTLACLWLVALVLSAVYVLLLREMKRRRRQKRRRRAAAEASGSHASTPYHEWCAQERKRIREQMRAAGQLNAMGGVVGSEPIGVTSGPIAFDQWYECPETVEPIESLADDSPIDEELLVESVEQPIGGYANGRMTDTPDPTESNYCNLHFVNDELDEEQPNRDHLSKQLMQHFEQMKLLQSVHQQWSLQEERHPIRLIDVKRCRSEDKLISNELSQSFNRICRQESVDCQLDCDSNNTSSHQLDSLSDSMSEKSRIRLEQLDVKQLEQLEQMRLIVNDHESQSNSLVRVDVDSQDDRK